MILEVKFSKNITKKQGENPAFCQCGRVLGIEPRLTGPQPAVLPLNYTRHISY